MLVEECIIAGEPPGRRGKHFDDYPFNLFWPLLTKCWERQPDRRPPASSLSQQFSSVLQGSPSTTLANAENTVAVTSLPGSSADVRTSTVLPPRPEAYGLSQTPPQRSSPTQPAAAPTGDEDHDMNTWPPNAPKFSSQEVPPEQTEERHTCESHSSFLTAYIALPGQNRPGAHPSTSSTQLAAPKPRLTLHLYSASPAWVPDV